jgi:YihY family inner membrane protein
MPPDHRSARPPQDGLSSQAVQTIEQEAKSFKAFLLKVSNDYWLTLSSTLAFTLLLSTFPIVMVLLSILGFLPGRFNQAAINTVIQGIIHAPPSQLHPTELISAINTELQRSSGIFGLIAVVSSLLFGSQLFVVLETCFSIVYRVRPRPLIRQQVIAISMFFLFLLLVPVMVFTASAPTLTFSLVQHTPLGHLSFFARAAGPLGGLLASFIFFEFIYVVVPNMHIRLRHGAAGALVSAVALQLYLALFPLYATYFLNSLPGIAGLIALFLIFFYYVAVIFILGAEVNAFFVEGVRPMPNDLVAFVTTMAGKLNQDIPAHEAQSHVDTRPTDQADKEHAINVVTKTEEKET